MQRQLESIAVLNAEVGLVAQYFQDPPAQQPVPAPESAPAQPQGQVHAGQTHGE